MHSFDRINNWIHPSPFTTHALDTNRKKKQFTISLSRQYGIVRLRQRLNLISFHVKRVFDSIRLHITNTKHVQDLNRIRKKKKKSNAIKEEHERAIHFDFIASKKKKRKTNHQFIYKINILSVVAQCYIETGCYLLYHELIFRFILFFYFFLFSLFGPISIRKSSNCLFEIKTANL